MIWVEITAGRHHGERGWYAEGFRDRDLREGFIIVNFPDQDFPRNAARKRLCDVRQLDETEARIAQGLPPPERPRRVRFTYRQWDSATTNYVDVLSDWMQVPDEAILPTNHNGAPIIFIEFTEDPDD